MEDRMRKIMKDSIKKAFELQQEIDRETGIIEHTEEAFEKAKKDNSYKYLEIFKLAEIFNEEGIEYLFRTLYDGFQIRVTCRDGQRLSFVEHYASYGSSYDMIEAWNFKQSQEVEGHLTAEQAYKYYEFNGDSRVLDCNLPIV